jgi:hypothetical protein
MSAARPSRIVRWSSMIATLIGSGREVEIVEVVEDIASLFFVPERRFELRPALKRQWD